MNWEFICGDNLEIMKGLDGGRFDLIYIDPPFFTGKIHRKFTAKEEKLEFEDFVSKDLLCYKNFMYPRLKEIHRLLKDDGSFYIHCDYHANFLLRLLCDKIFTPSSFINEIIFQRCGYKGSVKNPKKFSVMHDTIYFYAKNPRDYCFHMQTVQHDDIYKKYPYLEKETGRRYCTASLEVNSGPSSLHFHDQGRDFIYTPSAGKFLRWSQGAYEKKILENPLAVHWSKNNRPSKKIYMDEYTGTQISNLWLDVFSKTQREASLCYPTQKSERLLTRIIKTSSDPGDEVLDCFCGSGTTVRVAKTLGRSALGIDSSPDACEVGWGSLFS